MEEKLKVIEKELLKKLGNRETEEGENAVFPMLKETNREDGKVRYIYMDTHGVSDIDFRYEDDELIVETMWGVGRNLVSKAHLDTFRLLEEYRGDRQLEVMVDDVGVNHRLQWLISGETLRAQGVSNTIEALSFKKAILVFYEGRIKYENEENRAFWKRELEKNAETITQEYNGSDLLRMSFLELAVVDYFFEQLKNVVTAMNNSKEGV